jgi:hypothetical protein
MRAKLSFHSCIRHKMPVPPSATLAATACSPVVVGGLFVAQIYETVNDFLSIHGNTSEMVTQDAFFSVS